MWLHKPKGNHVLTATFSILMTPFGDCSKFSDVAINLWEFEFCRKWWVLLRRYCPFSDVTIMLWEFEFLRNWWVLLRHYCPFLDVAIMPKKMSFVGNVEFYWGATILIARGLLLSSSLGPGSFAFHKVIYSRLQPFTASPLEMTLWNPTVSIGSNATGRQYSLLMKFSCLKPCL